jgi:DNA-binding Xre family transcriptional regulator
MNELKFKIVDVARQNGLTNAYGLQKALDCSPTLAARLWKGNFKQIGIETIERLCDLFNCVPSDLYTYPPKNKSVAVPQSVKPESVKRQSVGSNAGELSVADIMKRFDAGETTVRRWLKEGYLAGRTENDLLEFQNSEWFQTLKRNENVK